MGECSTLTVWFAKHCNRLILNGAPSQFEMGLGGHPSSEKKELRHMPKSLSYRVTNHIQTSLIYLGIHNQLITKN
jgi:hypothetical protein